jgi:hypothetical protein
VPSLDVDGWALESAVERHREAPESFAIPSESERASLARSQRVKLLFLFYDEHETDRIVQCERMWVTITEVGEGRYVGRLENRPRSASVLEPGAWIEFGPEHVAAILGSA